MSILMENIWVSGSIVEYNINNSEAIIELQNKDNYRVKLKKAVQSNRCWITGHRPEPDDDTQEHLIRGTLHDLGVPTRHISNHQARMSLTEATVRRADDRTWANCESPT